MFLLPSFLYKYDLLLDDLHLYDQNKDLSLFILTWLYGFSQNARYKIEPQENIIKKDRYQFREFMIRRVEDE